MKITEIRRRRRGVWLGVLVFAAFVAGGSARAQDEDACARAAVAGQRLQRAGKLVEAHDAFVACARPSCVPDVIRHCTDWLRDVDRATPTIVVGARDETGRDVTDAKILIDGAAATEFAPGTPIALDPGAHAIALERPGGARASQSVVLLAGEKNRAIVLAFDRAPTRTTRPVPALAYVLGGIGAVALIGGAAFGTIGFAEWSQCRPGCDHNDRVRTELRIADVSLAVSVVALGAAAWVYFTRPTVAAPRTVGWPVRATF